MILSSIVITVESLPSLALITQLYLYFKKMFFFFCFLQNTWLLRKYSIYRFYKPYYGFLEVTELNEIILWMQTTKWIINRYQFGKSVRKLGMWTYKLFISTLSSYLIFNFHCFTSYLRYTILEYLKIDCIKISMEDCDALPMSFKPSSELDLILCWLSSSYLYACHKLM